MSFWQSAEVITDFRQCVTDKMSARLTAEFLTRKYEPISRSACISKAKRENVTFLGAPAAGGSRKRRPRARRQILIRSEDGSPEMLPAAPASFSQADQDIPAEQRKQLLDLNNETCRFPIGDPRDAGFFFCGAMEADLLMEVPYCERHMQITHGAYTLDLTDAERERRRRWANKLASGAWA